ncbi:unnamed protein product [Medioppia subpectinata]|uniref:Uncharacterized protein n=1 Tax=Medioppia subpectinata TaxID=1979941 RepID=A0A7R9Q630_9ACAR|nr:unnamed protein product [Medioppia subpectinata]CAG2114391.1 unnamed protein product [Medioppia subpectinata]
MSIFAMERVAIAVIATIGTISIMFELLGLLGAYKEHHCLTMTYAVLMLLATCASIGSAALEPAYWFTVTIDAVITTLAFMYARDLRRRQLRLAFIRSTGGEDPEFYPTVPVYPPPSYGATPATPGSSYPMQTHVVADPPAYKD